jgi:hypothetical protein
MNGGQLQQALFSTPVAMLMAKVLLSLFSITEMEWKFNPQSTSTADLQHSQCRAPLNNLVPHSGH